jgi:putative transposase
MNICPLNYDPTGTGSHDRVEDMIAAIPMAGYRLYDEYDHPEGNPKPFGAAVRAHILRCVKGWRHETALYRYLCEQPFVATKLGFDGIPDRSTLYRAWQYRFSDTAGYTFVRYLRTQWH